MSPCPSDNELGALVDRGLGGDEAAEITSHLDSCGACRQVVIAAVRGGAVTPRHDAELRAELVTVALGTPSLSSVARAKAGKSLIGSRVGRYELRALLGAGGMGRVYEAYDGELDRAIALKILRPELAGATSGLAERLVRESRIMAKVVHPAVITVHDVGRDDDAVYIAMELIRGSNLSAYLAIHRPTWREIARLFERAGQGLAAAHRAGVVHRDFKPDNVLVESAGDQIARIVVTDFGIARAAALADDDASATGGDVISTRADIRLTATGVAIGTPAYMAPEQLAGKPVDRRADVFAFSVSVWEALFGARPFVGATVEAIRAAMTRPPSAPRGGVPRSLVHALERGLAIDPAARWQELTPLLDALASAVARRRRVAIGAGAVGLVGVGIAGALVLAHHPVADPCSRGLDALDRTYNADRATAVATALSADPAARDAVTGKLASAATAWRETQVATCQADREPAQDPTTAACLAARRSELAGVIDDVVTDGADGARYATRLGALIGDPTACSHPAPGLLAARVPDDPGLRRRVTALRQRAFDAEAARDRADYTGALAAETRLVAEAATLWPPLHAEVVYLLGATQSQGGDNQQGLRTLREAAAIAEAAHADYIAATSWIQLVTSSSFDQGDAARALEYVTYAEAALDRIGRPAALETMLDYAKGTALVDADRLDEAEVVLRAGVALAERSAPESLPRAIQGLGFLYEDRGSYAEAVAAFRDALARLPATGPGVVLSAIVFRERLAIDLALLGTADEAEAVGREAVRIADDKLPPDNLDRPVAHTTLAQVLETVGKLEPALAEAQAGAAAIAKIQGERNERYGEALSLEAGILSGLDRNAEAVPLYARACDVIAFQTGEDSARQAQCWVGETVALSGAGRDAEALALVERAIPVLVKTYGELHPDVANAIISRGALHVELGHHAEAVADLERAVGLFAKLPLEPGHLAAAEWGLARELWPRDRPRARSLLASALDHFKGASVTWAATRDEAAEWFATGGKPRLNR